MVRSRGMPLNSLALRPSFDAWLRSQKLTPPNHIWTPTYVKSKINEQHQVLIPWVYFLIKCLDNRCLCMHSPTMPVPMAANTRSSMIFPDISFSGNIAILGKTAQFHLALGLWVQTFLFITENGFQDISFKWLHMTLSLLAASFKIPPLLAIFFNVWFLFPAL